MPLFTQFIVVLIAAAIAVIPPLCGLGAFSEWLYRALVCLVASCPCAIVISVPLSYYSGIGAASEVGVLIKGGKYIEALAKADTFVFDKTGTLTSGKLSVNKVNTVGSYSADEVLALAAASEKYSAHPIASAIREKANGLKLPSFPTTAKVPVTEQAQFITAKLFSAAVQRFFRTNRRRLQIKTILFS